MRFIFALMDSDGDGTVSLQEFQAAHEKIFKATAVRCRRPSTHHHHSADVRSPRAIYRDFTAGLVLRVFLGTSRRS